MMASFTSLLGNLGRRMNTSLSNMDPRVMMAAAQLLNNAAPSTQRRGLMQGMPQALMQGQQMYQQDQERRRLMAEREAEMARVKLQREAQARLPGVPRTISLLSKEAGTLPEDVPGEVRRAQQGVFAAAYPEAYGAEMAKNLFADPKVLERKTAKDANDRLRYLDTGELAFPDVTVDQPSADPESFFGNLETVVIGGEEVVGQLGNRGTFRPVEGAALPVEEQAWGPKYWSPQRHSYVKTNRVTGEEKILNPAPGYEYTQNDQGAWVATKSDEATGAPSSVQEYLFAVDNGYGGTFEQWRNSKPASTKIDLGLDATGTRILDETFGEIKALRTQEEDADMMMRMLDSGLGTGRTSPITGAVAGWMADFGVDVRDDLPLFEAFNAMGNRSALVLRNPASGMGLTGSTSDRDLTFLTNAVANVSKTEEANRIVLIITRAKARRDGELARVKARHLSETGRLDGVMAKYDAHIEANSLFTEEEEAMLTQLGLSGGATNAGRDEFGGVVVP